jgi:two-component sensor histidine kinase
MTDQSRRTFRWVVSIACLYVVAAALLLPIAGRAAPRLPALTPFVVGGLLAIELATGFLLYVRFRDSGDRSLLVLACAYLWSAMLAVGHLATFPDAVLPGAVLLGGAQSSPWTFQLWTNGYAGLALAAIVLEAGLRPRRIPPERVRRAAVLAGGGVVGAALTAFAAAAFLADRAPIMLGEAYWAPLNVVLNCAGIGMMVAGVALVLLVLRHRDTLYLWLGLALTAMLFSNVVSLVGGGRYTVGWEVARLNWILGACVLFLFLMAQFAARQRLLTAGHTLLEQDVAARTEDLTRMVKQRDLLLREVYHRVRNNLQVVNSLIAMESRRLEDTTARGALSDLRNRIYTLGLVHRQSMSSDDLEALAFAPFLSELAASVAASFRDTGHRVVVTVAAEPITVGLEFAMSAGLLTTELLSNAIKYGDATAVTVEFRQIEDGDVMLAVSNDAADTDDGPGPLTAVSGVGARIIEGLVNQLNGRMETSGPGANRVEIRMKLPRAA